MKGRGNMAASGRDTKRAPSVAARAQAGQSGASGDDVRSRLVCMPAGCAAEEVLLGAPSSGAGGGTDSDLTHAKRLALAGVTAVGLNQALAARIRTIPDAATAEAPLPGGARIDAVVAIASRLDSAWALNGKDVAALMAANKGTGA